MTLEWLWVWWNSGTTKTTSSSESSMIYRWELTMLTHSHPKQGAPPPILNDSIAIYMESVGQGSVEDVTREFFRHHAAHLHTLLDIIMSKFHAEYRPEQADAWDWVEEMNRIFIVSDAMMYIGT